MYGGILLVVAWTFGAGFGLLPFPPKWLLPMSRRRRTQAERATVRAIRVIAAEADTELYRRECSVCGRTIPKEFVMSGQSTRTTCGGKCALKSMRAREAARQGGA